MNIEALITALHKYDNEKEVRILMPNGTIMSANFDCDSWRGSYYEPFTIVTEDANYSTVREVIANLEQVDGKRVEGYKGGNYVLSSNSKVYLETGYGNWSGVNAAVTSIEDRGSHLLLIAESDQH